METGMNWRIPPQLEEGAASKNAANYSPLVLAYLGDAVYELYIRGLLVSAGKLPVNQLHKAATGYVKAKAQSDAITALEPELTEEELRIYKRGRNAKPATIPRHADVSDYHRATGFEALAGYLYLCGQTDRLNRLFSLAVETLNKKLSLL